MTEVFQLIGKLVLEGKDQFYSELEKTSKSGSKLASSLGKGFSTVAKVVGTATVAAVGAASTAIGAITKSAIEGYSEYEQLAGGMEKIFADMDTSKIVQDAGEAYKTMGMSANEYLAIINDVGASFASTMGDEAGYEAAKKGLTAISDYASGTGKNFGELQQKLALITRSTSSYQSIADQFSGILPATSAGFLKQAQAAGVLSKKYKNLTDVPIDEYQQAVTEMLAEGVDALNLTGNTAAEAATTLSGSVSSMKSAWKNLVTGIADENANMELLINNFVETLVGDGSGGGVINNILPRIEQSLEGVGMLVDRMIPIIVAKVPMIIEEWLPKLLESGVSMVRSILDGIMANRESMTTGAVETVTTLVNGLIDMLPEILVTGVLLLGELTAGIFQELPNLLGRIPELIVEIAGAFSENSGTFLEIGASIVTGIWEGICSLWSSLVENMSWMIDGLLAGVSGAAGMGAGDSLVGSSSPISRGGGKNTVMGSHADGLNYVPFDGYTAELHKGEMVVPAAEARMLRNGSTNSDTVDVLVMILDTLRDIRSQETVMTLNNREFGRAVRRAVNV